MFLENKYSESGPGFMIERFRLTSLIPHFILGCVNHLSFWIFNLEVYIRLFIKKEFLEIFFIIFNLKVAVPVGGYRT